MSVVLVDAGGTNIGSVRYALQRLGVDAALTSDAMLRAVSRISSSSKSIPKPMLRVCARTDFAHPAGPKHWRSAALTYSSRFASRMKRPAVLEAHVANVHQFTFPRPNRSAIARES